jgi:hypothetical protein
LSFASTPRRATLEIKVRRILVCRILVRRMFVRRIFVRGIFSQPHLPQAPVRGSLCFSIRPSKLFFPIPF